MKKNCQNFVWVRSNLGHAQQKGVFIGEVFLTYDAIFDDAVVVELVGWLMNSAKLGAIFGPDLSSAVLSQRPLASGSGPDLWSSLAQY